MSEEYEGVGAGQGRDPEDVSFDGVIAGGIGTFLIVVLSVILASFLVEALGRFF